jgi:hypothetical protein
MGVSPLSKRLLGLLVLLAGCVAETADDSEISSAAGVGTDPLAALSPRKIVDLPEGILDDNDDSSLRLVPIDGTTFLVRISHGFGTSYAVVAADGQGRKILSKAEWEEVQISPDRKWLVARDEAGRVFTAPVSGEGLATELTKAAELDFFGGLLLAIVPGKFRAYDLATREIKWELEAGSSGYGYPPAHHVTSRDQQRLFVFTSTSGTFVDPAGGAVPVPGYFVDDLRWVSPEATQFAPSGDSVLAFRHANPPTIGAESKLFRYRVNGASELLEKRAYSPAANYEFRFSPDGTKVAYRVIIAGGGFLDWPSGFVVRDLKDDSVVKLDKPWLGGRVLHAESNPEFLSDSRMIWAAGWWPILFDSAAPGSGPVDIVPQDLTFSVPQHDRLAPITALAPGDTGFVFAAGKERNVYFRSLPTGVTRDLGFQVGWGAERDGSIGNIEPPRSGRQSVVFNQRGAAWLMSLTHLQKCEKLEAEDSVQWWNGVLTYRSWSGDVFARTSDGRFVKRLFTRSAGYPDWVETATATQDGALFVLRHRKNESALYRVDLPEYAPTDLPVYDGRPHPELRCVEPASPGDGGPPDGGDGGPPDAGRPDGGADAGDGGTKPKPKPDAGPPPTPGDDDVVDSAPWPGSTAETTPAPRPTAKRPSGRGSVAVSCSAAPGPLDGSGWGGWTSGVAFGCVLLGWLTRRSRRPAQRGIRAIVPSAVATYTWPASRAIHCGRSSPSATTVGPLAHGASS